MTGTTIKRPKVGPFGEVAGGGVRLTADGRRVVERWLARHPNPIRLLAAKWPGTLAAARGLGMDDDDITAACLLGAVRAAAVYDPATGYQFSTLAGRCLRNEVRRAYAKPKHRRDVLGVRVCPLRPTPDDTGPATEPVARPHPPRELTDREAWAARLTRLLGRRVASWRDREIVTLRLGLENGTPVSAGTVAGALGLTAAEVERIVGVVLDSLGVELEAVID